MRPATVAPGATDWDGGVEAWLGDLAHPVARRLEALERGGLIERIWAKDPSVWKPDPRTPELADRLGWLELPERMAGAAGELVSFAEEVRAAFRRVLVVGMGGSSLAAQVFQQCWGSRPGFPELAVFDTTEPSTVEREGSRAGEGSLIVVSSKSGTTRETASLASFLWQATGGDGRRFLAITDPLTPLERLARQRGFRRTFLGPPEVGGRYAALSVFGLVPAALAGVELEPVAASAGENPGAWLGAVLAEAALAGRDKLTLLVERAEASFGLWVEQLVAESTGKDGRGILPVVEPWPEDAGGYGRDRLFVYLGARPPAGSAGARGLQALRSAGHPVLGIWWPSARRLGGEWFRWEFAVAVAGAVLGVNPFDQPNVAESKRNTERLLARGRLERWPRASRPEVAALLEGLRPGDYLAVLAYLAPSAATDERLVALQQALRRRTGVAVTVGYGPRYLHSTGQLHKGGPAKGHFLVVQPDPAVRVPVPDEPFDFGALFVAQAEGDLRALQARGRPVCRVESLDEVEALL